MKKVWIEGLSRRQRTFAFEQIEAGNLIPEYDAVCPRGHLAYQRTVRPTVKVHCNWCERQYYLSDIRLFTHYLIREE